MDDDPRMSPVAAQLHREREVRSLLPNQQKVYFYLRIHPNTTHADALQIARKHPQNCTCWKCKGDPFAGLPESENENENNGPVQR